jgi:DNA-binding SARP family transcriptional activator
VEFRLLGPVEVGPPGNRSPLRGAKQRSLLALLALRANRVVPTGELVQALWEDRPPSSGVARLHDLVWTLRRTLRTCGTGDCLVSSTAGYVLTADAAGVDHLRFTDLAGRGRRAVAAGDARSAADYFRAALAIWRGAALGGTAGDVLAREAAVLEEARITALEDCIDAELHLGRAADVVPELVVAVAAQPLRERLVGQLMLALYRNDRNADALEVYRSTRRRLAEELGLEPGPALAAIHTAILRRDPLPAQPEAGPGSPGNQALDELIAQGAHFLGVTRTQLVAAAVREYLAGRRGEIHRAAEQAVRTLEAGMDRRRPTAAREASREHPEVPASGS